jgi:hypothetical protein
MNETDEAGSTVTFKLPMQDTGDIRNPFHNFTKRRKGRAGTRFMMVCLLGIGDTRQPLYEDEVMLAGWNDSQQNGHTVKFWLCNDKMGHPFEGVSRKSDLMLSLVELDDDNEPIDQKMREKVEQQHDTGKQKPSNVAAMFCRTPEFWEWAATTDYLDGIYAPVAWEEESAKQWIYQVLGIASRAELDRDQQLATQFQRKVIDPYQQWYDDNYGAPF